MASAEASPYSHRRIVRFPPSRFESTIDLKSILLLLLSDESMCVITLKKSLNLALL